MKYPIIAFLMLFGISTALFSQIEPTDTDGNGYYNISTLDHLRWISENNASWTWNFELDNDIDASDTRNWNVGDHDEDPATPDSAMGWKPIYLAYSYPGSVFDGNGHQILNIYINRPLENLVAFLAKARIVRNLHIVDCDIRGANYVSALVSYPEYGEIKNCSVSGSIVGKENVGGICALATLSIKNCEANIFVKGSAYVGGLIACKLAGKISSCHGTVTVVCDSTLNENLSGIAIGGFIGKNVGGLIENCSVSGVVINEVVYNNLAKDIGTGGFVGMNYGSLDTNGRIVNCYALVDVTGSDNTGGFVGGNLLGMQIEKSFATGDVHGTSRVGGFVGSTNTWTYLSGARLCSNVNNCFATGDVSGTENVGGFIGSNNSSLIDYCYSTGKVSGDTKIGGFSGNSIDVGIYNCFWDKQTSPINSSNAGTGLSTSEMKMKSTFVNADWDFNHLWNIDEQKNNGYPYLNTETIDKQNGIEPVDTDNNGWRNITSFENLVWMSENPSCCSDSFELDNDIDASASMLWDNHTGFSPIGNDSMPFTGVFEGKNHSLYSLYIHRFGNQDVGLFARSTNAEIKNIGLHGVNITGGYRAGGLVGDASNTQFTNCSVTGAIRGLYRSPSLGSYATGGIIGITRSCSINQCHAKVGIMGEYALGGLVGCNNGTIERSFTEAVLVGQYNGGGIAGTNGTNSNIKNCYSFVETDIWDDYGVESGAGIVYYNGGKVKNCYSLKAIMSEGPGTPENCFDLHSNTIEEMKTKSTYTNAGWNFETIWDIDGITNDGYPFFKEVPSSVEEEYIADENNLLYPNPASDILNIRMTGNPEIKIYDLAGTAILSATGNQINIETLSRGMYFVLILQNGGVQREVFVKE